MNLTTNEIKKNLLFYFLYSRDFLCATTEMSIFNGSYLADIVALSKNYKFYEVEIKTNTSDLKKELESVKQIISKNKSFDKFLSKYSKHFGYLNFKHEKTYFVPHRFYFSIMYKDKDFALDALLDSPYGLMDHHGNIYKKAKDLHNEKVSEIFIKKLLQRISRVNYNLMNKDAEEKNIRTI